MLASLVDAPLDDPEFVYEPKYDGIRAIAEIGERESGTSVTRPADSGPPVHLWSRLGNEKTRQFPDVACALEQWARRLSGPIVLDGEIVVLGDLERLAVSAPWRPGVQKLPTAPDATAFVVFDLLRSGPDDLRGRPFLERRAALERLFGGPESRSPIIRISEMVRGDGRALYERALACGWEGLIAKRADSKYRSGKRTPDWRKLKIVHEQEFVVGGWTEPRHARSYFGALLLGVYESQGRSVLDTPERDGCGLSEREGASEVSAGRAPRALRNGERASARGGGAPRELIYVGRGGTGFNERELERVMKRLKPLETRECPFRGRPKTDERPHWVRPRLVAQIKFREWTADGKLRHPVYLGLRDDKKPEEVIREAETRLHGESNQLSEPSDLIDQLREFERSRRDGVLVLSNGDRLKVTNLHKVFWPKQKLTKGDLFRYYVGIAPCILPAVADRPLVMKRFPNGIAGKRFFQHRAEDAPPGVRVEPVPTGEGSAERRPQVIGGTLTTLLYTTQLAAISQDPWFSCVSSPLSADYVALDLDPPAGVTFDRVLDIARWIRDELDALGVMGVPKTSGADGLHIYIPLPPGTPYEAGLLFCQIVATVVSQKHPHAATVERSVNARGARVYVDYLQNILGKTLATAYSARASAYAGVSAPLTWKEIDDGVRREDFTIETMPARIKKVGDLWATLRKSKGVDLSRVARYADRADTRRVRGDNS